MPSNFLLYGASGYTGALIARLALRQGLRPILAGRHREKCEQQAAKLGLEFRTFRLEDTATVESALKEVAVVLNCAGPFSYTAQPMIDACLRTQTHYLDITGEPAVLEAIARRDEVAKAALIMLMPGVGFDVVPSDCLAAYLKARLPSATHLALGVDFLRNRISRGTMNTMVEAERANILVRQNGVLAPVPIAWKTRKIDFGQGSVLSITVPLGDVVTAYYSTDIPNIEVYGAVPPFMHQGMKLSRMLNRFLSLRAMQHLQKWLIQMQPPGPTDAERLHNKTALWGEVKDNDNCVAARLQCPEGYTLTALAALAVTKKVLAGQLKVGFQTPSLVYGADLILEIEGVIREDLFPPSVTSSQGI